MPTGQDSSKIIGRHFVLKNPTLCNLPILTSRYNLGENLPARAVKQE
jgi:hypothetical protein